MIITSEFLKKHNACTEGYKYVSENGFIGLEAIPFIEKLIEHQEQVEEIGEDSLAWANWLIVRVMSQCQCLDYAIFAAEQVLDILWLNLEIWQGDHKLRAMLQRLWAIAKRHFAQRTIHMKEE